MKLLRNISAVLLLTALVLLFGSDAKAQSGDLKNWPAGSSPKEVGKRLGENFVNRTFEYESGKRKFIIYTEVCAGYGALNIAKEIKDKDLTARLFCSRSTNLISRESISVFPPI